MGALAYLATPYAHYPAGLEAAFVDACALAGNLLKHGVNAFCPIAHGYPIAKHGDIEHPSYEVWIPFDTLLMERCDTLIVAHLDGWKESKGIAIEVEFFERAGKPIFDLDPTTMKMTKRR